MPTYACIQCFQFATSAKLVQHTRFCPRKCAQLVKGPKLNKPKVTREIPDLKILRWEWTAIDRITARDLGEMWRGSFCEVMRWDAFERWPLIMYIDEGQMYNSGFSHHNVLHKVVGHMPKDFPTRNVYIHGSVIIFADALVYAHRADILGQEMHESLPFVLRYPIEQTATYVVKYSPEGRTYEYRDGEMSELNIKDFSTFLQISPHCIRHRLKY
jgi:hypothetical protein